MVKTNVTRLCGTVIAGTPQARRKTSNPQVIITDTKKKSRSLVSGWVFRVLCRAPLSYVGATGYMDAKARRRTHTIKLRSSISTL